jgi:hypothetical protein
MNPKLLAHKEKVQNKKREQLILIVLFMAIVGFSYALFKM